MSYQQFLLNQSHPVFNIANEQVIGPKIVLMEIPIETIKIFNVIIYFRIFLKGILSKILF